MSLAFSNQLSRSKKISWLVRISWLKQASWRLKLGVGLVLLLVIVAVFAPLLTPLSATEGELKNILLAPGPNHWFGTDNNGVDIFAQVVYGARLSLLIAFSVVGLSTVIGLIVGSIAGYFGGAIDQALMRFIDVIYAFPGMLLVIALVGVMQSNSAFHLIVALSLTGWASYARLIRGEVMHLKERDFVAAARALGAHPLRQVVIHI
jgi:ABC-type dipeptide/oligopeptide/nickel transport system permease subunit